MEDFMNTPWEPAKVIFLIIVAIISYWLGRMSVSCQSETKYRFSYNGATSEKKFESDASAFKHANEISHDQVVIEKNVNGKWHLCGSTGEIP